MKTRNTGECRLKWDQRYFLSQNIPLPSANRHIPAIFLQDINISTQMFGHARLDFRDNNLGQRTPSPELTELDSFLC